MSLIIALQKIREAAEKNLSTLVLSHLNLTQIPAELSKLTQLTSLDLTSNKIPEIKGLEKLTKITSLKLSHNNIVEIKGLENLIDLKSLYLSYNGIAEIKGLDHLSSLENLYLSSNDIAEIRGLENLAQLNQVDLSNNHIKDIKGLERLTKLLTLNLNGNNIIEIKGLEKLELLNNLNLMNNQILEIKGLESLKELVDLFLNNNRLTEIKGLESLLKLEKLFLNENQITEIRGLENLTYLTHLELAENRLTQIKGVEHLKCLTYFEIRDNQLVNVKGIEHLKNLESLYLSENQLTEIKEIEKLEELTELDLHGNRLTDLPEYLLRFGKPILWERKFELDCIYVGENPFKNPPPEIIKQGNDTIEEYFDQRKKAGEELLNEAKLILLGDGRAGKTSLANRLLNKELPKESDRTQGVDIVIGEYSFKLANGKDFRINIWDFAGQDKYKTLHQLFYTESSVYVLVAESGNTNTDFDDWFQTAALFGEKSPLVLVLNEFKSGIGIGAFDSGYWKKQFPELLKEVITVNLGTRQNLVIAEEYIRFLAQTLPHTKYVFPSNWAAVRRVLNERRDEQYITLGEYFDICRNNNLPEKEGALILSSVLHKVGDCLHYQKSDLLKQMVILKNEWATDAVYKILDDKIVAEEKCGFFDSSDIKRIWSSEEYVHMRPQLLELMKQFKLAYQLTGKEEYVTPPLLPPARPHFSWPDVESLELYIEYDFLPKALLTQFIVTRHADIAEGRTLVWRNGVVLKWDNEALAEVSKIKLEGKDAFYIRSHGNSRKEMMTVILKTFRGLYADYKGIIKYKEKVPCICEGCRSGKNKQYYYDFDNLKFRLEKGRYEVECDYSLERLNILKLLENTFVFEQLTSGRALQLKENGLREKATDSRVLKLFLACSNELEYERSKIEIALSRKSDIWRKQGIIVDLLMWEDGMHIGKSLRSQDDYNLDITTCDFFVLLFYSKVGKYSLEEFDKAQVRFGNTGMPRIRLFQKDVNLPKTLSKEDAYSRFEFLDLLKKIEHFPVLFDNTDKLLIELINALEKLLEDDDFINQLKVENRH